MVGAQAPTLKEVIMEKEKQSRKAYKKHGEESAAQKMMSFRVDVRVLAWLQSKPNKGRYINDLIYKDMKSAWVGSHDYEE